MNRPRIYCDMDGVLVNFIKGASDYFQMDILKNQKAFDQLWKSKTGWATLMHEWPTFWMDLEPMPHARELWRLIAPYHPAILTAIPEGWPSAGTGKEIWCKRHLPKFGYHPFERVYAVLRSQKQQYAKQADGTPNLLIDDFQKNIAEWEAAGGIGIQYVDGQLGSVRQALQQYF